MTIAIILAGGLGTRLRGIVPDLPKPLAPLNGRPFLEHQLEYWIDQGVKQFIISVGYKGELITTHFGHSFRSAQIEYVIEENPLGTGGALLLAIGSLKGNEPFLLLNGDTYYEVNLTELKEFHFQMQSEWTLSIFRTREFGRYMGLSLDSDGRIMSLQTEKKNYEYLANGGVYFISQKVFQNFNFCAGERYSLENDIMPEIMLAGGRFYGYECEAQFIDIGIPDDYYRASKLVGLPKK